MRVVPATGQIASPAISVARASGADAPELLALQRLAYQTEAELYQDWTLPPLMQTEGSLREEIAQSLVLAAREGTRLVGSVRARANSDGLCQIGRLIVHPERQGNGIGTRLMREIEAAFPDAAAFELFTGSLSASNLRLYERLGYRRVREVAASPAITLVFLEKRR